LHADLREFGFTLADLLPQFVFQSAVWYDGVRPALEPAKKKPHARTDEAGDNQLESKSHFFFVAADVRRLKLN
jgi:hypothetical protein